MALKLNAFQHVLDEGGWLAMYPSTLSTGKGCVVLFGKKIGLYPCEGCGEEKNSCC